MAKIKADIFGTLTHWHCGHIAGGNAAWASEQGDTCPRAKDFEPTTPPDYILGYQAGWDDSPYTVAEITFGPSGPGAPVYVRGYNSKAELNRAIRASQCKGV